jgi:hypothetical protein
MGVRLTAVDATDENYRRVGLQAAARLTERPARAESSDFTLARPRDGLRVGAREEDLAHFPHHNVETRLSDGVEPESVEVALRHG